MKSNFFLFFFAILKKWIFVFFGRFGWRKKRVNDVSSSATGFFKSFSHIFASFDEIRERLCWLLIQLCNDTRWNLQDKTAFMQREKLFNIFMLDEDFLCSIESWKRRKKCKRKEKEADWQASDSISGLSYFYLNARLLARLAVSIRWNFHPWHSVTESPIFAVFTTVS